MPTINYNSTYVDLILEGRMYDSAMLADSGLLDELEQHALSTTKKTNGSLWQPGLSSACSPPVTLQRRNYITNGAIQESHELRSHVCRVAFWGHCKFFKMSLSAVHKMYIVAAILRKALTCMYGNSTSEYFTLNPPTIHNYFA